MRSDLIRFCMTMNLKRGHPCSSWNRFSCLNQVPGQDLGSVSASFINPQRQLALPEMSPEISQVTEMQRPGLPRTLTGSAILQESIP